MRLVRTALDACMTVCRYRSVARRLACKSTACAALLGTRTGASSIYTTFVCVRVRASAVRK